MNVIPYKAKKNFTLANQLNL